MQRRLIYLLFLLSGMAGLIYEIVWGRLLVLTFGNTAQSMIAVITAFLGGLGLGSYIAGRISDRYEARQLIRIYAFLEIGIGLTGSATLLLLPIIRTVYGSISDGFSVSAGVLAAKFLLSVGVLIWPTTLMGATLPVLSRWIGLKDKSLATGVSWLYAVNTLGAVFGVILSTIVLIEQFGLSNTVLFAAVINILIGSGSLLLVRSTRQDLIEKSAIVADKAKNQTISILPVLVYSFSGFAAIAYQVLWTRLLTPIMGTFVYAFATILAVYLLGIVFGSLLYPLLARMIKSNAYALGVSQLMIGLMALGSAFVVKSQISASAIGMAVAIMLPATLFMGLSFPAVIALLNDQAAARSVGFAYFGNTIGSIIGGFVAGFVLIPSFGTLQSVLLMSIVNFILAVLVMSRAIDLPARARLSGQVLSVVTGIITFWLFISQRDSFYPGSLQPRLNAAKTGQYAFSLKEDEVATVFGYSSPTKKDQNLFIDGVSTTLLLGETKLMAHIPIWLHRNPQRVLTIAFGMGSTFRSSLSYGLKTDVVELVPSVPSMMPLFQPNAEQVLADPNGRVIINDGRNYIFLTETKYDIVTIDPPPPFNASGTTVLYSKEFYEDIALKLNPNGIVSQWMWFGSQRDDIAMATKSFLEVFPYVIVWRSPSGEGGMYLIGSFSPIQPDQGSIKANLNNEAALADLRESYPEMNLADIGVLFLADKEQLVKWVGDVPPVSDYYPRTEYFLLRHFFKASPTMFGVNAKDVFAP